MSAVIPFPRPRDPEYLSVRQLADRWGLHIESIYRIPREVLAYVSVPPGSQKPQRRYPTAVVVAYEERELKAVGE